MNVRKKGANVAAAGGGDHGCIAEEVKWILTVSHRHVAVNCVIEGWVIMVAGGPGGLTRPRPSSLPSQACAVCVLCACCAGAVPVLCRCCAHFSCADIDATSWKM